MTGRSTVAYWYARLAYLKQKGHKTLTSEDIAKIINTFGTEEEKRAVSEFPSVQQALTDRLKDTSSIGLVIKQAKVSYDQYYKRQLRPAAPALPAHPTPRAQALGLSGCCGLTAVLAGARSYVMGFIARPPAVDDSISATLQRCLRRVSSKIDLF